LLVAEAVKWDIMDRNPATDATLPKYKAEEREIWTAEMLMQAIDACENKWLKVAFHLAFAATVRTGELLGLTWDCVDISEEAISENRAYVFINKQVERVSKEAVEELDSKEVILIFPSQRKNGEENKISIPEGVDPELLMKVLGNPEMAALITSLAKTIK
jgi:integrase